MTQSIKQVLHYLVILLVHIFIVGTGPIPQDSGTAMNEKKTN